MDAGPGVQWTQSMFRKIGWILAALVWCGWALSAGPEAHPGAAPPAGGPATSKPAPPGPVADKPAKQPSTYRGPKVRLTIGPRPGKYLRIEQRQIMQTLQPAAQGAGGERRNWHSLTISGELAVAAADAGGRRKLAYTCRGVKQTIGAGEDVRKYDSAAPPDQQDAALLQQWKPLVGWRGVRVVGAGGRSETLEGIEGLLSAVEPGPRVAEIRETLRELTTALLDELAVGWWGQLIPAAAVGPGDEWQASVYLPTEPALGTVKMACNCLLQDIVARAGPAASDGPKVAVVDFTAAAVVEARALDRRMLADLPLKIRVRDMRLDLSGRLRFDLDAGLAIGLRRDLTAKGLVLITDAKGTAAALRMTLRSNYEKTLKAMR